MHKRSKLAMVAVGVVASIVSVAQPASAHTRTVTHGYDYATVASDHHSYRVCDREADNNSVTAYVWYTTSSGTRDRAWISAWPKGDCNYQGFHSGITINHIKICENRGYTRTEENCSNWYSG